MILPAELRDHHLICSRMNSGWVGCSSSVLAAFLGQVRGERC